MKKTLLALFSCFLIAGCAEANILVEPNNLDDSISYRSYKSIIRWNTVDDISLIKKINKDGNILNLFRVTCGEKYNVHLLDKTCLMKIGEEEIVLDKLQIPQSPSALVVPGMTQAFYIIPEEAMQKVIGAPKVSFTVNFLDVDRTTEYKLTDKNLAEMQRMAILKYEDYNKKDVVNPKEKS